jgi:hypothetical protein
VDWKGMFLQERTVGEPQNIPQSVIYELVNETINVGATDINFPNRDEKTGKCVCSRWFWYLFKMPLTHTQFMTIPDPLSKRNENYYPLSILFSILWIFLYTYVIVWFTYDVTVALNLKFSIIPMFVYPFGIVLRDVKKFRDFKIAMERFQKELPDQEISLAETYSPQIFQMTGLAGFAWLLNSMITGK